VFGPRSGFKGKKAPSVWESRACFVPAGFPFSGGCWRLGWEPSLVRPGRGAGLVVVCWRLGWEPAAVRPAGSRVCFFVGRVLLSSVVLQYRQDVAGPGSLEPTPIRGPPWAVIPFGSRPLVVFETDASWRLVHPLWTLCPDHWEVSGS